MQVAMTRESQRAQRTATTVSLRITLSLVSRPHPSWAPLSRSELVRFPFVLWCVVVVFLYSHRCSTALSSVLLYPVLCDLVFRSSDERFCLGCYGNVFRYNNVQILPTEPRADLCFFIEDDHNLTANQFYSTTHNSLSIIIKQAHLNEKFFIWITFCALIMLSKNGMQIISCGAAPLIISSKYLEVCR